MSFVPNEEQKQVRRTVRGLYDAGICLVAEWCKRIPELTINKWEIWTQTSGFTAWWTDLLPEHNGVTIADLKALEFEATKALLEALQAGDLSATKTVIQMINASRETKQISDKSMDDWFEATTEKNGWEKEWN
jgi:hypothetical protein